MGRRDEPELEELSKLLRRLETMEVAPKPAAPSRKAEPEPQTEYIGALRGAAPAKSSEQSRAVSRSAAGGERETSSTSTKAIIIGAATAAAVSSVIAATVVLWTSGGKRSDDASRLTFYAAKEQGGSGAAVRSPDSGLRSSPADAQRLLQRADTYLRAGKPDEARLVLEEAARAGSGVAAMTLGAMYDPGRVAQFANVTIKADPTVARAWYERAKDLGIPEANDRLAELAAK